MTPTRWQHVQDLVSATLELPETERANFLRDVCGDSTELQHQIKGLVESYEHAGSFIEQAVAAGATEALATNSPVEGDRIGPYEITEEIGHGGMGTVYCARRIDDQFRQHVAIKVIRGGFAPEMLKRFRVERQILATLTHPNIARLLDGGITTSGLPYLVMEYIKGKTIDCFAESRNAGVRDRLVLFQDVCAAMQYAHQNLIVHRDIKPANVMVTEDGTPKLLDFGIAKLLSPEALGQTVAATRPAERLMTPEYASPEQIRGEAITTATDVYGLGVLLYELLTGKRPFRTANLSPASVERLICETPPVRPSTAGMAIGTATVEPIPKDLDNIVLKAMHKEPNCRYTSAAEFSNDIQRYLDGFPVTARGDSWSYKTRKFVMRHKIATAAVALFAITTTALSIGMAVQATRARQEAQTANQVSSFLVNLFEYSRPDKTQGRISYARDLVDLGAQRATGNELSGQPVTQALLLDMLGTTYRELGVLDRAQSLLSQAYDIRRRAFGPESEEAAGTLQTLAEIATDKGDFTRAGKEYQQVLSIYTRTHGRMDEKTAEVIDDIGELKRTLGDLEGAKQRYLEAIAISTQLHGPDDWQVLNAKNDLEAVLADEGDYRRAEALARDVLVSEIRVMGPNNPMVALTLDNLGYVLAHVARFKEAQSVFQRSLDLKRKVDGNEHPAVALSLEYMGWMARELGQYEAAQTLGEEAVAMAAKLEGKRAPDTIVCDGQLGLTMLARKNFEGARELLEPPLQATLAVGNPNNPDLAEDYDRVGRLDLATNKLSAARLEVEHGLQIRQRFYGRENDNVASSLNHLGEVLAAQGNYVAAEQRFRKAIEIARAKFKAPHTITADGLFALGTTLMAQRRWADAKAPLLEALEMRQKLLPPGHPDIREAAAALERCAAR